MTVNHILEGKGREVATASPTTSIKDVCDTLAAMRIGAVVLTGADGRIVGIVSERDIVRALSTTGAAILEQPVSTIMTRTVVTCSAGDSVPEVMRQMTEGKFRHVPVLDAAGRLAGIISIGDVVKSRVGELEAETNAMREYIVMA